MKDFVVWDSTGDYLLDLSKHLGTPWFGSAQIVTQLSLPDGLLTWHQKKVLIVPWWRYDHPPADYSWADLVVCYTRELIHEDWDTYLSKSIENFNTDRLIFVMGGKISSVPNDPRLFCPLLGFFHCTVMANDVHEYDITKSRPYLFDAMLGIMRRNRAYVFNRLVEDGLLDQSLVSIMQDPFNSYQVNPTNAYYQSVNEYTSPALEYLDDPSVHKFKQSATTTRERYSANILTDRFYKGQVKRPVQMSQIIPVGVYENSWFSIVVKTNPSNFDFLTEKTAKPIMARRIFVVFGSQGILAFLRQQGLRTFDGLIDESYDQEPNELKRYDMAWQQIRRLAECDPVQMYQQAQPVLDHNFNTLMDCTRKNFSDLQRFIKSHTDRL
jgi:hypothetical protein